MVYIPAKLRDTIDVHEADIDLRGQGVWLGGSSVEVIPERDAAVCVERLPR